MNSLSKNYDKNSIKEFIKNLLDKTGSALDEIQLCGSRPYFIREKAFVVLLGLLEEIERELLIQWKIFSEQDLEALFLRQKSWYYQDLRDDKGLLARWNELRMVVDHSNQDHGWATEEGGWKNCLLTRLSDRDFYGTAKTGPFNSVGEETITAHCGILHHLWHLEPQHLCQSFFNLLELGLGHRPDLLDFASCPNSSDSLANPKVIHRQFNDQIQSGEWKQSQSQWREFWSENSGGIFSTSSAFVLKRDAKQKVALQPVMPEQTFFFEDLIGIEQNIERLKNNTQRFLTTGLAHNVLLWGGRGTGKSSCVLALLAEFAEKGLRLIEVDRRDFDLLPDLAQTLQNKKEKFILFFDDIGFENEPSGFHSFKSILEGSLLRPSSNVLMIATSNRKDLVRRGRLDPTSPEQRQLLDEMRAMDDRFGLKIYFEPLDKKQLEKILGHLASQMKIKTPSAELYREFKRFASFNNHDQPSGRTVRQFMLELNPNSSRRDDE